jgi:hypothetical protein
MEWHLRMHSNERPFACSVSGCGKAFTQNQTLRNHMKQFHKSQVTATPSASTSNSESTVNAVPNSMPSNISVSVTENSHLTSTSQMSTEIPISLRELKQEPLQTQPQVSNLTHHSSIQNLIPPQTQNLVGLVIVFYIFGLISTIGCLIYQLVNINRSFEKKARLFLEKENKEKWNARGIHMSVGHQC